MNLDVRTMYLAMAAACFIVAVAIFIFHSGRFRRDGTLSWTIGWVFQGAFWAFVGLRGVIWNFVSVVVASTFLTASFSFLYAAVREFQGSAYNRKTLLLPPVATFVFFWYFSVYVDNVFYRIIFISLLSILQIIAIVWALFRDTSIRERRSCRLTGFAFLVMEVIWITRLLEGFTLPYGHLSVLETTTFRNASVLVAFGAVILSGIGFVLMIEERAEETLREVHERATWLARFPEENPSPVLQASAEGSVLYRNSAAVGLPGWECEVGKLLPDPILPLIRQAMAEGRETEQDVELAGRFYFVSVSPFPEESYANVYGRDSTERKRGEEALREKEKWLVADLEAMTRLQKIGTLFVREGNLESVLGEIVEAAIAISGADFGNIQLLDPKSSNLHIVAQRGFPTWWLDFWNKVAKGQGTCGTALERGERIIIEDVEQSPIFVGTPALEIQLKAGVRAVQSTPLVSRSGKSLGMFSTHYKMPHRPDDRALQLLGLLARHAADIIDRAQVEEALRLSEEHFRALVTASSEVVYRMSPDWAEMRQLHGRDFIPDTEGPEVSWLRKYIHPDDQSYVMGVINEAIRTKTTFELEHRVLRVDGTLGWTFSRAIPLLDTKGEIVEWFGAASDITERRQAEEALRDYVRLLDDVIDGSTSPIFLKDKEGKFITINAALERMLGKSRQELKGKTDYDIVPKKLADYWRSHDARVMATGKAIQIEEIADLPDGHHIFLANKFPLVSAHGQVYGVGAISHDITERKRMEEELRRSRDELEIRVQERTAELAAINEELRVENEERLRVEIFLRESENRLRELSTALLSTQERERKMIAGEIHDSLGASLAAAKFKMESVLKEMVDDNPQARVALESVIPIVQGTIEEARRIQMSLRPSMLDDLGILATINWFCRQFESTYSNIRVKREVDIQEHEVPESLKLVIYRVLQEALNNIAKHSKADRINLLLRKMDGAIELGIQDNGQGFDLSETQSRIGTGRGLGLDSMRERAELSGGSFSIESSKGAGTVIRATWPIEQLST